MKPIVIKAENISKRYRLGVLNSGSLKQDIYASWNQLRGATNNQTDEITENEIWALKNLDFEIKQGETIGFVGKNGAGKSTLLKILSRITLPTTGSIKGIGRVASLLEVGTGFHPELTGRENVMLNGQILGMKRQEISSKFDQIIDFSGVGKFVDTPVKRYSTGMYLRLSFAVAAHLDPDILIVDEALAVGDTEFQSKCLNKMKDVANKEGKTVLFVSHNMQAVRSLCQRALYLEKGKLIDDGTPEKVIAHYLQKEKVQYLCQEFPLMSEAPGDHKIRLKKVEIRALKSDSKVFFTSTPLVINFEFWKMQTEEYELWVGIHIYDLTGFCILDLSSASYRYGKGLVSGSVELPANLLRADSYYITFDFIKNRNEKLHQYDAYLSFDLQKDSTNNNYFSNWNGLVKPGLNVNLNFTNEGF